MNRRSFFKALLPTLAVLPLMAKGQEPKPNKTIIEGDVQINGSLRVDGVKTGTALYAGDFDSANYPKGGKYIGIAAQGPRRDTFPLIQPEPTTGEIMEKFFGVKGASSDPQFNYRRSDFVDTSEVTIGM